MSARPLERIKASTVPKRSEGSWGRRGLQHLHSFRSNVNSNRNSQVESGLHARTLTFIQADQGDCDSQPKAYCRRKRAIFEPLHLQAGRDLAAASLRPTKGMQYAG
ncbi:hypothetical protein ATY81_25255 [Rhizobium sp. R72]|nr:hypothetical protein ATY81_25255 [Rhizobium sp. R72]OWW00497.1 hypothetical protein ATY80_25255 [Rhizobium sp. R711]